MFLAKAAFFSPLIGFLAASFFIPQTPQNAALKNKLSQLFSCGFMGLSACFSLYLFVKCGLHEKSQTLYFWQWFDVESLNISFGMMMDKISLTMMAMVTGISFLIHVYSIGYMSHDHSIPRFMGYLSLFTFFMLALIMAPNLVQLFLGWEGVGLASYLLIGFWYQKPSANTASIKAFVTNRVGDAGLIIGFAGLFALTGTLDIATLLEMTSNLSQKGLHFLAFGYTVDALPYICIALFIGVMGKSAQFGLHTWLPDAMEGPTPVSALIHAATMVTAGVYLLIRLHPLFVLSPLAQNFIAIIGAATCFFAATVAIVQDDIKKIIAYSTCSQLGYMVMAAGMNAVDASFFHLITHAFFKALLFLGAGAVIHSLSDEQNIDKMGGLYRHIPFSYTMMWVGSLALAGIPFFSGFYSKDSILVGTFSHNTELAHSLYWIGIFVAFMTALYSWRLIIKVFHGESHVEDRVMAHLHESPWIMRAPLLVLAIGATFLGFFSEHFFITIHENVPSWVLQAPIIMSLSGVAFAYFFFFMYPHIAFNLTRYFKYIYVILLNKWFFDKIYQKIFIQGAILLGNTFWQRVDMEIIDRFGPNGISNVSTLISKATQRLQTGYVYHYAFAMLLGVAITITYILFKGEMFS